MDKETSLGQESQAPQGNLPNLESRISKLDGAMAPAYAEAYKAGLEVRAMKTATAMMQEERATPR